MVKARGKKRHKRIDINIRKHHWTHKIDYLFLIEHLYRTSWQLDTCNCYRLLHIFKSWQIVKRKSKREKSELIDESGRVNIYLNHRPNKVSMAITHCDYVIIKFIFIFSLLIRKRAHVHFSCVLIKWCFCVFANIPKNSRDLW